MKLRLFRGFRHIPETWNSSLLIRFILFMLMALGLYFYLVESVVPKTYDLQKNTISNVTVAAPMEVEDTEATAILREEAKGSISPVYQMQEDITKNQLKVLDHIYRKIAEVRIASDQNMEEQNEGNGLTPPVILGEPNQAMITHLRDNIPYQFTDETYRTMLKQSPEALATMKTISSNILSTVMLDGVRMNEGMGEAQKKVSELLATSDLEIKAREAIKEIVSSAIVPNIVFDEEATEQAKETAFRSVKPVKIYKGEILVGEGEYITDEIYRKLGIAGLLTHHPNYSPYFGLGLLVLLITLFFYHYISHSSLEMARNNKQLLMFLVIILLNLLTMKIIGLGQDLGYMFSGFLVPAAFGSMLITLFLDLRLALFSGGMFAIAAGFIFNADSATFFDYRYAFVVLASTIAGAYSLRKPTQRRNILASGLIVVAANLAVISAVYMLFYSFNWSDLGKLYGFGVINGLLSAVLTIGFIPFFESAFGILSTMKLIELSNPNHPLLRRLLMETPGTYHHSIMVANLSEASSEAIGANGLLSRVGSYYHDVGKMKRPHFFIENVVGRENPHDRIAPSLSRTIIIAHPYDGAKMLEEYNIPKAIRDIAEQHHGTTLLKFFYHKACKESDSLIPESDYRYPGPKAQTKEAAIVGICDSVEAAVRSLAKPTPDKIEGLVRKIVKDRLDDGQLNECDLTLHELEIITRTICETLQGIFHNRIEYPEEIEVKQA
ncbi:HD family phosphohydrolase [Ammoniphilus resinae]|uniref:Nucleotidyltransferase with HDIG domain n=1 Tax=Ammoniphilus resinae TaxID=861532 RepID=A0ABS4GJV6_9BACL|nr:putative nucleotidyltransferase with HDIG domain [Ammoniphilus resinae]